MIFIFNLICIALLFFLNKRIKMLIFILLILLLVVWGGGLIPKEFKKNWMFEIATFCIPLLAYTILLISIYWGKRFILLFNPQGIKYENIIRNVYLYAFTGFAIFTSYMFFIKGVIYD